MAELRANKSGINADVRKKLEDQYDEDLEFEVREWLEAVSEEPIPEPDDAVVDACEGMKGAKFYASMRDGTYLCKFLKALYPEWKVPSRNLRPSTILQIQRETIGLFLSGCKEYGVDEAGLFETESLHGAINLNQVLTTFVTLGSVAQSKPDYDGPQFGPKRAQQQHREFSEEKLAEGRNVIGLQMGSNKGASRSGMTDFGTGRQVYDARNN